MKRQTQTLGNIVFGMAHGSDDIPGIIALIQAAHLESRFARIPFSAEKVRRQARLVLAAPRQNVVLMAWKDNRSVGLIHCSVGEYVIGSGPLIATVQLLTVDPALRRGLASGRIAIGLMRGAESWARGKGADELLLNVTSGVRMVQAHRLAGRMRFEPIGGSYAKRLT